MCGIAGFVGRGDKVDLENMANAIRHRGPDGEGYYCDSKNHVYLAHKRLAIVDPEGGVQPMWSRDRTISVIFNGEIYNHKELRAQLVDAGHEFSSDHSDTEVLLYGWREWGTALPEKLNGMFAFVIWDVSSRRLFLARDRFGEKPLFWAWQKDNFYFASELSAIVAHRKFDKKINYLSLKKYFAYGFIPSPNAFYKDCHKLRPGHWLEFDLQTSRFKDSCYWAFRIETESAAPSFEDAVETTRNLLFQSVKRRMMSDVPIGVFLSGGIDSGLAAAAMCHFMPPAEINSFSIGFNEASFDETPQAQLIANALGTNHRTSVFDQDTAKNLISSITSRLDEPIADPSLLPTYHLSKFTRKDVKVALSGDGGDELFAGYDTFAALNLGHLYKKMMPNKVHKGIRCLADLLPKSNANMSFDFKVRRALMGLDYGAELWNPVWLSPFAKSEIEDLFHEATHPEELYSEALTLWHQESSKSTIDRSLEYYMTFYLTDNILTKVDRAAMMNGLEARSIFLDNDLVDYVRYLPSTYKFDGRIRKKILKYAADGLIPKSILSLPKKGFGIPLKLWMISLNVDSANQLNLNQELIQAMIHKHQSGKDDHRLALWSWHLLKSGGFI